MPYAGLTKILLVIGFLSLLHAAYSSAQRKQTGDALIQYHRQNRFSNIINSIRKAKINTEFLFTDRTYLRDTDQEKTNTFLPLDVSFTHSDTKSKHILINV